MPRETWWSDDVPPIQYGKENRRMRLYGGFMLILGMIVGLGIGYLLWGMK